MKMEPEIESGIRNVILEYYRIHNINFDLGSYNDTYSLMVDYFEILRKSLPVKKWNVKISKELKVKSSTPAFKEWLPRLKEIKKGFENGLDMNHYLSKRYKESGFRDRLLTCWKIHHLHFFPEKTRGDMLLFVIINGNTVYMIDAIPHNKKFVFSTYNLLNIVYDNWKFLYKDFEIQGITDVTEPITTDEEIGKIRNLGATTFIKIRDTVYCLDMMASSGHSAHDVMLANNICNTIRLNAKQGTFKGCEIDSIILTGYHRPCFIIMYRDKENNLYPHVL